MPRTRPSLGTPFGTDGPWLAAIADVLGDLYDLIDERLPKPQQYEVTVAAKQPAPDVAPKAIPVSEPAPDIPGRPAGPVSEPAPDEPDDDEEPDTLPAPPPRSGRGSGLPAWRAFADAAGVDYDDTDSRDDIIVACELAEVISAE